MVVDSFKQSPCASDVSLIESHVRALTYLISVLVNIIIFDCFCAGLLLLDIAIIDGRATECYIHFFRTLNYLY